MLPSASRPTRTSTWPPPGTNLTALSSRASRTRPAASGRVRARRPSARSAADRSTPAARKTGVQATTRSRTARDTSSSPSSAVPDSTRASASRPSSSSSRRSASSKARPCSARPGPGAMCGSTFSSCSTSVASGLRSWWEASATKSRWRPMESAIASAMVLKCRRRWRSSGGPVSDTARACRLPAVSRSTARSRSSTGRISQRVIPAATRAAAAKAANAPAAMRDQRTVTSRRAASVGTAIRTAPLTRSSRPTGSASTTVRGPQGRRVGSRSVERPVRARRRASAPSEDPPRGESSSVAAFVAASAAGPVPARATVAPAESTTTTPAPYNWA